MKFQPKTEREIAEANLWQNGIYSFEISNAVDAISKAKGNEMIKLDVTVYNDQGNARSITDYLMEAIPHKLRHAAEMCGALAQYEKGDLSASDFIGKTGYVKLRIKEDKSGQYPAKNEIVDYVVPKSTMETAPKTPEDLDDGIPF